jgi:phospholipase A-2-activating protein
VTGTGNGGVVDGEAFDLVIPVEIEMPGGNGGQVRKLEIGYNQGQNPFQVAQAFIDKHFLDQNYLNQIADYISQRSSHYSPPLLQDASLASTTGTTTTKTTIKSQMFDLFPSKAYNTFESIKITKLLSTVLQLNTNEKQQQQATQKDIESLTQIVQTVQETAFYHASTFSKQDISILIALIRRWKPENIYPLLDLARLVLIHPQGANVLASTLFIERVIELGTSSQQTSTTTTTTTTTTTMTRMLTLRVLANLFFQPQARECLVQNKTLVISSLASYLKLAKDNKLVSLSLSTVLFK